MKSVICTLFEGDYHHGVAVLANSLYRSGFRGTLWAGFRGDLPPWLPENIKKQTEPQYFPADGLELRFVRLIENTHFANYKPDFCLYLLERVKEADSVFYFDPDIVVRGAWKHFENWISFGVAAVEDVNSPLDDSHPRRKAWHSYFKAFDIALKFRGNLYLNSGFIGIKASDQNFLNLWKRIQGLINLEIGEEASPFDVLTLKDGHDSPIYHFSRPDQDALNIAMMSWDGEISLMGGEGMDFKSGGSIMSHKLGPSKPWRANYFLDLLKGKPPSRADKEYWGNVTWPIAPTPASFRRRTCFILAIVAFLGRFYRSN